MNIAIENMIKQQLRPWGITDETITHLFEEIPRESFLGKTQQSFAYADMDLSIGQGQYMLSPKVQAKIIQVLRLQAQDVVFEIGTGTGFLTILLAKLSNQVISADIFPEFTEQAQKHLEAFSINNVKLLTKDAWNNWEELSKQTYFDVIVSTAAFYEKPEKLLKKLSINGRLFAIVGKVPAMSAVLFTRIGEESWQEDFLFETLVPYAIGLRTPEVFEFLKRDE